MNNLVFKKLEFAEFAEFSVKVSTRNSFLQTPPMQELLSQSGWQTYPIGVLSGKELVLAALLISKPMTGGKHFELQYGPVYEKFDAFFSEFFYASLKSFVKKEGGLELLAIPNEDYQSFDDEGQPTSPANDSLIKKLESLGYRHQPFESGYNKRGESIWHYMKDLSNLTDEKDLLASYSKIGATSVKATQRFGIEVSALDYEELVEFKKMTASTSLRKGYDDHDLAYYENLYAAFGEDCQFLGAKINFSSYQKELEVLISNLNAQIEKLDSPRKLKQKNELIAQRQSHEKRLKMVEEFAFEHGDQSVLLAGALFIYGKGEAIYLFSGSHERYKAFNGPFAIQHASMLEAIRRGIFRYNFFGIAGTFDGSDGVLHYKKNFSGYPVEKIGYFSYSPHPVKKFILTSLKKVMGRG